MGDDREVRHPVRSLQLVLGLAWFVFVDVTNAGAQESPETTAVTGGNIIPRPNSGVPPTDAGDRGGGLQTALFVLLICAVMAGAVVLVRQSRRARAERGF